MRIDFEITSRSIMPFILLLVWAFSVLANLSLMVGSYAEHEPTAGNLFGILAALIFIFGLAAGFFLKRRRRSQKKRGKIGDGVTH